MCARALRARLRSHAAWIVALTLATIGPLPDVGAGDTLAHVRAAGELRWGADAQGGAPYVFQDPTDPNHLIGFEVDLVDALAHELGVRARPVQGQWETLLELLARGDFDVALNGIEVAPEKERVCRLSRPYYAAAERLTVRRDDAHAPRTLAELRDRPVGTLPGSLAERILARADAAVRSYEGGQNEIYADLALGRTDAVLLDAPITRYYAEIDPKLRVVDGAFGEVRYALAVRRDDAALAAAIDDALGALARAGTLRHIYERWGLWNAETAALLGDPVPASHAVAEAFETWRAAVGALPPFLTRVREWYPRSQALFARAALLTLALSFVAMGLAIPLGVLLALARTYGPTPLR